MEAGGVMAEDEEIRPEDRTTAIGLARYARDYFDAAKAADDV